MFCRLGIHRATIKDDVLQGFVKPANRRHKSLGSPPPQGYISRRWRRGGRDATPQAGKGLPAWKRQRSFGLRGHGPGSSMATASGAEGGQPSRGRVVQVVRRRKAARSGSPRRRKARQRSGASLLVCSGCRAQVRTRDRSRRESRSARVGTRTSVTRSCRQGLSIDDLHTPKGPFPTLQGAGTALRHFWPPAGYSESTYALSAAARAWVVLVSVCTAAAKFASVTSGET